MSQIRKIKVGNQTYDVGQLIAALADYFKLSGDSSTNLEISSPKHINIEPGTNGDIQLKPGDDIRFYAHHRATGKQNEVHVGVYAQKTGYTGAEADVPCKLEFQLSSLQLSTKEKDNSDGEEEILDVNINTGKTGSSDNKKGYLKVRARAIDLRCEEHGGIALQPMGADSHNKENKIKFEHGGGDGKEFLTMNTEKASIFTDEYRFNKDGIIKMANRIILDNSENYTGDASLKGNGKYKAGVSTESQHYSYKKNTTSNQKDSCEPGDDFYDFIKKNDPQTTWKDLIQTSHALNTTRGIHTKITEGGSLEIKSFETWHWLYVGTDVSAITGNHILTVSGDNASPCIGKLPTSTSGIVGWYSASDFPSKSDIYTAGDNYNIGGVCYKWVHENAPQIKIEGDGDVELDSNEDVKLTATNSSKTGAVKISGDTVKVEGLENGVNLGATPKVIFLATKLTKGCNTEAAQVVFQSGVNNNTLNDVYFISSTGKFKYPANVLYSREKVGNGASGSAAAAAATVWSDIALFSPNLTANYYQAGSSKAMHVTQMFFDAAGTQPVTEGKYWVFGTHEDGYYGYYVVEVEKADAIYGENIYVVKKDSVKYVAACASDGVSSYVRQTYTDKSSNVITYNEDVTFVPSTYTGGSGEVKLTPGETYGTTEKSFSFDDLNALISHAKTQGWIS